MERDGGRRERQTDRLKKRERERWVGVTDRVQVHHLHGCELLGLTERPKANVRRRLGIVHKGPFDGVQVMGADGNQRTLSGRNNAAFVTVLQVSTHLQLP